MKTVASVVLLGMLAGCQSAPRPEPVRSVEATYSFPALRARLPEEARVPAVIAAAEETLRRRGYSIARADATEETGQVVARPPRTSDYPTVTLVGTRVATGTLVEVRVSPLGDKELSRSVLDGTLQRLGL
jgi:hypothetical protein